MHTRITLLALAAVLAAGPALAADTTGAATYRRYCAACHGSDGKGDGVVSGLMTPRPTNLTTLAASHGGTYPTMLVIESIDGRKHIAAHGDTDMPVWGEVFVQQRPPQGSAGGAEVRGTVQDIVQHIATIQAK